MNDIVTGIHSAASDHVPIVAPMMRLLPARISSLSVLVIAIVMCTCVGCDLFDRNDNGLGHGGENATSTGDDAIDDERAGVIDHAAFAPARLRVHPLTRFVRNDPLSGKSIVETRVEFLDQFGHTTKGRGELRFEMFGIGNTNLDRSGNRARLGFWSVDISGLSNNLLHYDDVTRTYRFALQIDEDVQMPSRIRVRVTMWRNFRLLDDEFELSIKQP